MRCARALPKVVLPLAIYPIMNILTKKYITKNPPCDKQRHCRQCNRDRVNAHIEARMPCPVQFKPEKRSKQRQEAEAEQRCGAMRRQYRHAARHEACAGCHSRDTAIPSADERDISAQTSMPQDPRRNTRHRPLRQRLRQEYMHCGVSSQQ